MKSRLARLDTVLSHRRRSAPHFRRLKAANRAQHWRVAFFTGSADGSWLNPCSILAQKRFHHSIPYINSGGARSRDVEIMFHPNFLIISAIFRCMDSHSRRHTVLATTPTTAGRDIAIRDTQPICTL
jgi:hypothetical protein